MKQTLTQFGTATLLMLSICGTKVALAGERGGNGGDIVRCVSNGVASYRVLDSVVIEENSLYSLRSYETSEKAFEQIYKKLDETYPLLARSLKEFLNNYQGKPKLNSKMPLWSKGRLDQIKDENLKSLVPPQCDADPIQAVALFKEPTNMYYYDPSVVALIRNQKDEFSWLMIHEWLRIFTDDSHEIRLINGYFHSEEFLTSTENDMQIVFGRFGFISSINKKSLDLSRIDYDRNFEIFNIYAKKLAELTKEADILLSIEPSKKNRLSLKNSLTSLYGTLYSDYKYAFRGLYDLDTGALIFSAEFFKVEEYKGLILSKLRGL